MTTVRLYEPQDEPQLRDIAYLNYTGQFQDTRPTAADDPAVKAYLSHIVHIQQGGKGIVLVAEQDKKLTGFVCLLKPENGAGESAYAFMSDLFVVPECRKQGVGSQLTRALEEQARLMGATRVALRVEADNAASRSFYIKAHYQEKFLVMSKELPDDNH